MKKKEKIKIPKAEKVLNEMSESSIDGSNKIETPKERTLFNELVDDNRFGSFSISFSIIEKYLEFILPLIFSETLIVKADMDMKTKMFNYIGYNKMFEKSEITKKKITNYLIQFNNTKESGFEIKAIKDEK